MPAPRRLRIAALIVVFVLTSLYYLTNQRNTWNYGYTPYIPSTPKSNPNAHVHWSKHPDHFPVTSFIPLPTGAPLDIPTIQIEQPAEDAAQRAERLRRRNAVKESFTHSWEGYKKHAWLRDEVAPLTAGYKDTFGGWAATLVDSLDSLWIMGLKDDFETAVDACQQIDFSMTHMKDINVFETTIRYMGGFLGAYDISGGEYPVLLAKAVEVGDLLMSCFDTPNRMPITRWDWQQYMENEKQMAPKRMLVSELGSLSLEFTHLSQLTGEPKYYDAIQRISDEFEKSQNSTKLPGMWPVSIDAQKPSFSEDTLFTLGGMSDSLYEYFPKQYLILGGLLSQPKKLYENFIKVARDVMFFRIYNPDNLSIMISGDIRMEAGDVIDLQPRSQHLSCFAGGMVGLASRIFDRPDDLNIAEELVAGCVWAYDASANGIAPEIFSVIPCPKNYDCKWSEEAWHDGISKAHGNKAAPANELKTKAQEIISKRRLMPGFTAVDDHRYILRPEAIESVFLMWRITGNRKWQDAAWRMFERIEKVSRTEVAAAAIPDITQTGDDLQQMDSMESFWLAETLKYFYLCFEEFGVISLDEYVLNTEAHPLRRPR